MGSIPDSSPLASRIERNARSRGRTVSPEFTASVDRIQRSEWDRLLPQFNDGTLYQTWSYGEGRWGESAMSHLVVSRGDRPVGLAQVAVRRLPLLGPGIAYVPWGPVWRREDEDPEVFRHLLRALRAEYADRRGLLLRIAPNEQADSGNPAGAILADEGYRRTADFYRTRLVDLNQPIEEIHQQMSKRWKRALRTAERLGLQIEEGTGDDLYGIFKDLHSEMVRRKGFVPAVDVDEFEQIQRGLPDGQKMHILICWHAGKPTAALIASLVGNIGVGLLGATATEGLSSGSFHLLNSRMLEWLKESGAQSYDFGGYDPSRNQGTATFKDGLPGADVSFVGRYEVCSNRLSGSLVGVADRTRSAAASWREARTAKQRDGERASRRGLRRRVTSRT